MRRPPSENGQAPSTGAPEWIPPRDLVEYQLRVALTWVARGCAVLPCSPRDKAAMVPGFGASATAERLAPFRSEQQVREWWGGRFKRAHVGLLAGPSGLVILDIDVKGGDPLSEGPWAGCADGYDVMDRLVSQAGAAWPVTYQVMTPSGGCHLYFRQPEGEPIGCATGEKGAAALGPWLDVRGVGGYVIAAGSYSPHQTHPYRRISSAEVGAGPLPGWLETLMREPYPHRAHPEPRPMAAVRLPAVRLPVGRDRAERYAQAALRGCCDELAALRDGRKARVGQLAVKLGAIAAGTGALDEVTVTAALMDAARAAGMTGADERYAERAIRSGWQRGMATPKGVPAA